MRRFFGITVIILSVVSIVNSEKNHESNVKLQNLRAHDKHELQHAEYKKSALKHRKHSLLESHHEFSNSLHLHNKHASLHHQESRKVAHGKNHQSNLPYQNRRIPLHPELRPESVTYRDHHVSRYDENCVCTHNGPPKLRVYYNRDTKLSAAINESSNIGLMIDPLASIATLFDGNSGVFIIENTTNPDILYFLDDVWKASQQPFGDYFDSLNSTKPILEHAQKESNGTSVTSLSKDIEDELTKITYDLDGSPPPAFMGLIGEALKMKGPFSHPDKDKGSFEIHEYLSPFLKLNFALADWLSEASGLDSLSFNLTRLFGSNTGYETMLVFLDEIGRQADLVKVLGSSASDPVKFAKLYRNTEEAVYAEGLDKFDISLTNAILFLTGHGSMDDIINAVLAYTPKPEVNNRNLQRFAKFNLEILENQFRKYNNSDKLQWYYDLTNGLINDNVTYSNVNISDVVNFLIFNSPKDVLESSINILRGLLVPGNIPLLATGMLHNRNFQQFIICILTTIREVVSHIPIIGSMAEREVNMIVYNLNRTLGVDFSSALEQVRGGSAEVCWKDIRDTSLGVIRFLSKAFGDSVRAFINGISNSYSAHHWWDGASQIVNAFRDIARRFGNGLQSILKEMSEGSLSGTIGDVIRGAGSNTVNLLDQTFGVDLQPFLGGTNIGSISLSSLVGCGRNIFRDLQSGPLANDIQAIIKQITSFFRGNISIKGVTDIMDAITNLFHDGVKSCGINNDNSGSGNTVDQSNETALTSGLPMLSGQSSESSDSGLASETPRPFEFSLRHKAHKTKFEPKKSKHKTRKMEGTG